VPKAMMEMRRRGFGEKEIEGLVFGNPAKFLGQSGRFRVRGGG